MEQRRSFRREDLPSPSQRRETLPPWSGQLTAVPDSSLWQNLNGHFDLYRVTQCFLHHHPSDWSPGKGAVCKGGTEGRGGTDALAILAHELRSEDSEHHASGAWCSQLISPEWFLSLLHSSLSFPSQGATYSRGFSILANLLFNTVYMSWGLLVLLWLTLMEGN